VASRVSEPILITGSHRSGTTWVGRTLASADSTVYLDEPFHPRRDATVSAARFDWWFTYVCAENEHGYVDPIRALLDSARSRTHDEGRATAASRPIIKDPLALFSAPWLASRFRTCNVVMIRHPAAFAGSLKVKGWTHPFAHFLAQPLLMRDRLQPFVRDLMTFARAEQDIVEQAALLWNIIHATILAYQDAFPDWIYLRHEDLSRHPLEGFRGLFDRLDLPFASATTRHIDAHALAPTSAAARGNALARNSLANIDTWKTRLTGEELARLRPRVEAISSRFYSDADW
jgi:hypothetical protein